MTADNSTESLGESSQSQQPEVATSRHRGHAMTLSRSHDGFSRPSIDRVSPGRRPPSPTKDTPPITAPLLMPPPTTLAADIMHKVFLGWLRARQIATSNADAVMAVVRLGIFFGKMVTLARPCWPFMVNLTVGGLLVVLAGMDLGIPRGRMVVSAERGSPSPRWTGDTGTSIILLGLHVLGLWVASRFGLLCAAHEQGWGEW